MPALRPAEDAASRSAALPHTLLHTLSIRPADLPGQVLLRGTLRAGTIAAGAPLRYRDASGVEHGVRVVRSTDGPRHVELLVEGEVAALAAGRFLYSPAAG